MLKRKTSLTKRDSAREFTGFCGKSVTYKTVQKHTPQFTGELEIWGTKAKCQSCSLLSNYKINRSPTTPEIVDSVGGIHT